MLMIMVMIDIVNEGLWVSFPKAFQFEPELGAIQSESLREPTTFESLTPCIFDEFLLKDEIGWIYLLVSLRILPCVVIGAIEGTPEGNCPH